MSCNDALLLEKVPPVSKEQRLAIASGRTAVNVRDEDVFINTNLVRLPLPFSVIDVWFAVEKHIFHCHIARRIGIW